MIFHILVLWNIVISEITDLIGVTAIFIASVELGAELTIVPNPCQGTSLTENMLSTFAVIFLLHFFISEFLF